MKKSKLFLSLMSMCFALAVLCFGVYAANQVNYSISGNITYQVEDCYVYVTTSVYKSTRYMSRLDVRNKIDDASQDITAITQGANLVLMQDVSDSFDTLNNSAPYELDDLDLSFSTTQGSEAYAYFFVINVRKMSEDIDDLWVAIDDEVIEIENTYIYDNMFVNVTDANNGGNLIVAIALDDQTTGIDTEDEFSFCIRMEVGDITTSEWNLGKLDIDELEAGNAKAIDSDISGLVVIPSEYNSTPITNVKSYGFANCELVREVYLPTSVITLNERAFDECQFLNKINIENVTSFGGYCFQDDWSIVKLELNNSVTKIPDKFIDLGPNAGGYLYYVNLPQSLVEIGDYAFVSCDRLVQFEIPAGVTKIGKGAFGGCVGLNSLVVSNSNVKYTSKSGGVQCNCIVEIETNKLVAVCKNFVIPNTITKILDYTFYRFWNITLVQIPNSVTEIGDYCFYGCIGISSISISNNVTNMGEAVFYLWELSQTINIEYNEEDLPVGWDNNWNSHCSATICYGVTI